MEGENSETAPLKFAHVDDQHSKPDVVYKTESSRQRFIRITLKILYIIYALYILGLIAFGGILRQSQRGFVNLVAMPLQRDLKLRDQMFGLITGPLFSFWSAVGGMIIGRLTDLYSRKWNMVILFFISGIATSLHGLCTKDWHLAVVRSMLAVGLSGLTPISMSLLPDFFDEKFQASVIGVFNIAAFSGAGLTFLFGMFVDTATSNWKTVFMALGVPSILLGFLTILTLYEPEKGALDQKKSQVKEVSTWVALNYLLMNGTVWSLNIMAGLCFMATNSAQVWGPTFYQRVHGLSPRDLSRYLSWTAPLGGIFGTILGALLATFLTKWSNRFYAVICIVGIGIATPIQAAVYLVPNGIAAAILTAPMAFVALSVIPSMYLLTIKVVPLSMRSLATSWFMFFLGGIGSLGPLIVGWMNDVNFPIFDSKPNPLAVRWSLFTMCTGGFTLALLCAIVMFFLIPRDFRRLDEWIAANQDPNIPQAEVRINH